VTISSDISSRIGQPSLSLEAFDKAAREGASVHVTQDGAQWRVLAQGNMPASGRPVAWVEPDPRTDDTRSAFVDALRESFTSGISRAVARELDLGPSPGQPLSSRTVKDAIAMAESAKSALAGVDFLTQLQFSAAKEGAEFHRVCRERGIGAESLTVAVRQQIDSALAQHFAGATSPVAFSLARQWLNDELSKLAK
jgi:hypothetical protein